MDLTRPIQYALIPIALCAWAVSETLSMPIWWAALLVATILIVNWLVLSGLDWLRFLPNRELLMEAFVEELRGGDYPAPPEALGEAEHYYQELVSDPSASTDLRISAAAEVAILDAWREARLQAWFRLNKVKMGALRRYGLEKSAAVQPVEGGARGGLPEEGSEPQSDCREDAAGDTSRER